MKKKNFFTGSVFQFYAPEIRKYAFCKFYDFTHIEPIHGLLCRVFDQFADTTASNLDFLKTAKWLFGHRSVHHWPDLKKDTGWTYLGILNGSDDQFVPDFKGVQAFPDVVEDEKLIGPWYPILNLTKRGPNCDYSKVHHLERKILTAKLGIEKRTGMEYCRINGKKVEEYFNLEEKGTQSMYKQMINVPVYSDIPEQNRGKALIGI